MDTAAPAAPAITGSLPSGSSTNSTTPTFSGNAEPGSTVAVRNGANVLGSAVANNAGVWSLVSSPLANGNYSINATATDAAGNTSGASVAYTITVDTIAPEVVSLAASPSGTVRAGDVVSVTATMSEAVQAGSSITVTLDIGTVVTLTAPAAGTTLVGSFAVQPGQTSTNLIFTAIGLTAAGARDIAGNPLVSTTVPARGLSVSPLAVDAEVRLVTPTGFSSNASLIADRRTAVTAIPITFTSPVSGFTLASVKILLNGRSVSLRGARLTGSGASYVLTIPVRSTNARGLYTLQLMAGQVAATANGAPMKADQAIYWGKGASVGFAASRATARSAAATRLSIRR